MKPDMTKDIALALEFDLEAMVRTLMRWSDINSGSFNISGLEKMAAALLEDFAVLGCERRAYPLPPIEGINQRGRPMEVAVGSLLRFWKRPEAPMQVLLVGHMDTVYGATHTFQNSVRKSDNILQGPGVTDMKGGLLVMLEALKAFEQSPYRDRLGWEVIINPDEEIGSLASSGFLMERAKNHRLALLFEPAMDEKGTIAGHRRGSGKFTIVVHGKAAHVGRDFAAGANAIYALAKIIQQIDTLNGKRDNVVLNVGQIEGGGAVNVVPDLAICRLDIRTSKMEDEEWVWNHLQSFMSDSNQGKGIRTELFGKFTRKPKLIDENTKKLYNLVLEISGELGQALEVRPSGGSCDGNNLASIGLPNVDTLGVWGGKIHSPEEYVLIDSIAKRSKLTYAILSHLAQKGF